MNSQSKNKEELQYRYFEIKKDDIDKEKRMVKLSFSSEDPYQRYFGIEILDHSKSSVNLKRLKNAAPLLLDHDRSQQIGVVESAEVAGDKKGRAVVRFSKSQLAEEIFQDVQDGIRRNVSVGYTVDKMVLEEEKDGVSTYRVMEWTPLEVSIVPIPADNTVGVGRNLNNEEDTKCQKKITVTIKPILRLN